MGVTVLWVVCAAIFVLYLLRRMGFFVAVFCGCVWVAPGWVFVSVNSVVDFASLVVNV